MHWKVDALLLVVIAALVWYAIALVEENRTLRKELKSSDRYHRRRERSI